MTNPLQHELEAVERAERLAEAAVPQVAAARFGARAIVIAVAVIAALLLGWFLFDRLVWAPERHKAEVAQLKVNTKAAEAVVATAADGRETGDRVQIVHDRIERITRENTTKIMAAPGAETAFPPAVDQQLIAGLCMRDGARGDPACDALPGDAAGIGDRADAMGSDSAGANRR